MGDTVEVTAAVRNEGPTIGMAMVDLGAPPGFEVVEDDLRRLQREGTISRYERRGRQLVLYLVDLEDSATVRLRATRPVEASTDGSRVYDYYDPTTSYTVAPTVVRVAPRGENATG